MDSILSKRINLALEITGHYRNLIMSKNPKSSEQLVEECTEILDHAVQDQLVSDVPLVCF